MKTDALHTRSSTSRENILGQLIDFDGDIQMPLKEPEIMQHSGVRIQKEPLREGMISREMKLTDPTKYEEYILKNYDYSTRLVDTSAFQ